MSAPRATYRLQLREHMDFAGAARLAPYLARLGVSHLYLAPICEATPQSTHGYDAIDFNRIEPALGGEDGLRAMQQALAQNEVGLIVDFVPNHMAATPLNPWWRDVLEWGAASSYAQHFDVDWTAPKLLIPVLGSAYGDVLGKGELHLKFDKASGAFSLAYHTIELPLAPLSYATILARAENEQFAELIRRFALAAPDTAAELKSELAALAAADVANRIDVAVRSLQADGDALHALHEAQVWRLAHWRTSRESLTYRRFFEISDLVGVRVENPRVFDDVHRLILSLVAAGDVSGLRIDHIDGLAEPVAYLKRLRSQIAEPDFYVVTEKILEADEELPPQWPVAGTTGYEFINALADLFVNWERHDDLTRAYHDFIGSEPVYAVFVNDLKRRTLTRNLAGELDVLTGQAHSLAQGDVGTRDFGADTLRRAIIELATGLPVYRTYVDAGGPRPEDRALLQRAAETAKATREVEDETAIDFIVRLLLLDLPTPDQQAAALNFAIRLQQTTGPLMAKAVEDTLFYRYNRLIALNEVGGDPGRRTGSEDGFHAWMLRRQKRQPLGMNATSTHDTKRGEDARARIYAISEMPAEWGAASRRWAQLNARHRGKLGGSPVPGPEPEMEWFFYQSLLGAWPADLDVEDAAGVRMVKERMAALMQKATREAKLRTSWTQPDEDYELALAQFVDAVVDPQRSGAFLRDFLSVAAPLFTCGALTSLSQLLIKLTAPGIPDVYQGAELWDLSLVDPDNRMQIDFTLREKLLAEVRAVPGPSLLADWKNGAIKLRLLCEGLTLRGKMAGWDEAGYVPLAATGAQAKHVVGFARTLDRDAVIAVGVRNPLHLLQGRTTPAVPVEQWKDTSLQLPHNLSGLRFFDVIANKTFDARASISVRELLCDFPVALLSTRRALQ